MGDLKTYFDRPAVETVSPGGDSIISRGSDPNADGGRTGDNAVDPFWTDPCCPVPSGEETRNSVSTLPPQPNRWEPSGEPPEPPSLEDRNPGTIDER